MKSIKGVSVEWHLLKRTSLSPLSLRQSPDATVSPPLSKGVAECNVPGDSRKGTPVFNPPPRFAQAPPFTRGQSAMPRLTKCHSGQRYFFWKKRYADPF